MVQTDKFSCVLRGEAQSSTIFRNHHHHHLHHQRHDDHNHNHHQLSCTFSSKSSTWSPSSREKSCSTTFQKGSSSATRVSSCRFAFGDDDGNCFLADDQELAMSIGFCKYQQFLGIIVSKYLHCCSFSICTAVSKYLVCCTSFNHLLSN